MAESNERAKLWRVIYFGVYVDNTNITKDNVTRFIYAINSIEAMKISCALIADLDNDYVWSVASIHDVTGESKQAQPEQAIDYKVTGLTEFSATQVTVEAISNEARFWFGYTFGYGCVSVSVPKSKSVELIEHLQKRNYNVHIV